MGHSIDENLLAANIDTIRSVFKMDYQHMQIMGAFTCTVYGVVADEEHIRNCRKLLKSRFSIFSNFRGHLELLLVVKMSLAEDPEDYLDGVVSIYESLNPSGMIGNEARVLAAMILYDNIRPENLDALCDQTVNIYRIMRENHPFLTDQYDLPFAALMAIKGDVIDFQIEDIERCYELISPAFLLSKNETQTVCHILSLSDKPSEEKSGMFLDMYDAFKDNKIGMTTRCMPILATLVYADISIEDAVYQTIENDEILKQIKEFGSIFGVGTETRRMFAAAKTVLDKIQDDTAVEGTVISSVLSLIISIETMAVAVATSTSTSHG